MYGTAPDPLTTRIRGVSSKTESGVSSFMTKTIWRAGRITKNCCECGAQTTGYVDTGKEPYALCINCAKAKGLLIDQKAG